jgi:hypothetical protein
VHPDRMSSIGSAPRTASSMANRSPQQRAPCDLSRIGQFLREAIPGIENAFLFHSHI